MGEAANDNNTRYSVSGFDIVSAYLLCWTVVAVVSTFCYNVAGALNPSILLLKEKHTTVTAPCTESGSGVYDCPDCPTFALLLSAVNVPSLVSACAVNMVYSMWKLLLANDVETQPGPLTPHETSSPPEQAENTSVDKANESRVNISSDSAEFFAKISDIMKQQLDKQTSVFQEELGSIRQELSQINSRCENIDNRCARLEIDQGDLGKRVTELHEEVSEGRSETNTLKETVRDLQEELRNVRSELDRMEGFSRRDNLRFYGIPQAKERENFDTCAEAVVDTLNKMEGTRTWTQEDIVRAHRIGYAKEGEPRPMIARFTRWKDKMFILTNKPARESLNSIGIRVSNDLTRQQYETVTRARQSGMRVLFKNGRMTMVPAMPRHDRGDLQIATSIADDRNGTADRGHYTKEMTSSQINCVEGRQRQPINAQNQASTLVSALKGGEKGEGGRCLSVRPRPSDTDSVFTSLVQQAAESGEEGKDNTEGGPHHRSQLLNQSHKPSGREETEKLHKQKEAVIEENISSAI